MFLVIFIKKGLLAIKKNTALNLIRTVFFIDATTENRTRNEALPLLYYTI